MKKKSNEPIILLKDDNLSTECRDILDDKSIRGRFSTMKEYFESEKIDYDDAELQRLIELTDDAIKEQVFTYAVMLYRHMELSGDWTESGEQQIKVSFCRNLLQINPTDNVSEIEAIAFLNQIDEEIEDMGLASASQEELKTKLFDYKFNLFGTMIERYRSDEITQMIRFIWSELFLQGGQYGGTQEYILGTGKKSHRSGYDVVTLKEELVRTPNNVMSMAAIIGHRSIYIRIEVLKTIFSQKWLQLYDYTEEQNNIVKSNSEWNISEGIKDIVLSIYKVSSQSELKAIQKPFLKDMAETILCHELGHGGIQHDLLDPELGALGEATKIFGETVFTSLHEFLADFTPPLENKIEGPIWNMITISKSDPERARRMFFMYLSDIWFYNTEDSYMFCYSDMMCLVLLSYISDGSKVDFDKMAKQITFRKEKTADQPISLFERIFELYTQGVKEIKTIATHAKYDFSLVKLSEYEDVHKFLVEEFRKNDGYVDETSHEFLVPYWVNVLGYVRSVSDAMPQLDKYLKSQEKKILAKIFVATAGRKVAEDYQFDHRKYIMDRCKALKIQKYPS